MTGQLRTVRISALGIAGGALAGAAIAVLLQQYAVSLLTGTTLIVAVLLGVAIGALAPMATGLAVAARHSPGRRAVVPPVPTAPVPTAPVPGPAATHVVGEQGAWGWDAPDPTAAPSRPLPPRTRMQLLETQANGWCRVRCEDGWTGWMDATTLQPPPT